MKNLLSAVALAALAGAAQATVVYSNNFDGSPSTSLGVTATVAGNGVNNATVGSYAATYGNILRSDGTVTLTLSNLPVHTGVSLRYVLALLESWDSRDGGCCSPDNLDFSIDGTPVASYTYNNALGSIKDIGGGTLIAEYVQFDSVSGWSDTVADMSSDPLLSFAHSASSISFTWQATGAGWQGGTDEAFGLDNIVVDLRGVQTGGNVPEPGTLALGAAAAAALLARRRRSL